MCIWEIYKTLMSYITVLEINNNTFKKNNLINAFSEQNSVIIAVICIKIVCNRADVECRQPGASVCLDVFVYLYLNYKL